MLLQLLRWRGLILLGYLFLATLLLLYWGGKDGQFQYTAIGALLHFQFGGLLPKRPESLFILKVSPPHDHITSKSESGADLRLPESSKPWKYGTIQLLLFE